MKASYFIKIFILLFIFSACKNFSDEEIISKTIKKLNSIQTIEYVDNYESYNDITGEEIELIGNSYFDFRSNDTLIGAKYIIAYSGGGSSGMRYFDGKSVIDVVDNKKEIIKNDNPYFYHVNSSVGESIAKLRQVLPLIQSDSAVTFTRLNDTIINNVKSYYFKIEMRGMHLGLDSIIQRHSNEIIARYNLAIAKSTFLPVQFEWVGTVMYWYYKNTFSQIKLNKSKDNSVWSDYENYSEEYIRLSRQDWVERTRNRGKMLEGAKAIEWTLQDLQDNAVTLSALNTNHKLLMFWFPGCVPCLRAVPVLNELEKNYARKGLKIYAIEFTNIKKEFIENYVKEKEVAYSILYNGKETANQYGVVGAPTFYLIDKTGTIIYSQAGLNEKELINSIESLLK